MSGINVTGGNFYGSYQFNNKSTIYNNVTQTQATFTKDELVQQIQKLSVDDIDIVMTSLEKETQNCNKSLSKSESSELRNALKNRKEESYGLVRKYLLEQVANLPFGIIASLIANAVGAIL